ncbi:MULTISPECIES: hypothetical protein [Stenotrophomonas]|uniref:hypothetical protein n=1 Tax=Stenotrophomonas TaxID=40323 RepID=UPI00089E02EF|nr:MULTISPECIES: hypothetical protein [Stenotrophomonas]AOX62318.1 hypothetical protein BIZ42_08905 [Stenotrophomonas sp. LM091]MCX2918622.1 hypothetical protein [Stenotrophomonas rhizophila]
MTVSLPLLRRHGWRTTLFTLLTAVSLPATAAAQAMVCGTFVSEDTGTTLTLHSANEGVRQIPGQAPEPYLLSRLGDELKLADLDNGGVGALTVEDGGRLLSDRFNAYRLQKAATCRPATVFPAASCRAEIGTCLDDMLFASNDRLRQWCHEDVPAACKRLLANFQTEAREADRVVARQSIAAEPPEPDVCKPESAQYDEDACLEAAREAVSQAFAKALLGGLTADASPLPAAQLDEITALCQAQTSGTFCAKAAEALWDAGRLVPARDALHRACTRGHDPRACERAAPLAGLDATALSPVAATSLPCGSYVASQGLMDHLPFGDGGMIDSGFGGKLRARLVDGDIRVRHDQGDDFVFKRLANGNLIGMDSWNRFSYYAHTGEAQQCSAPVVFVETPLPQDCPTLAREGGAQACCAAGKLQGCNAAGHQLALRNRWAEASPFYLTLCTAGVREGCENLASVYEHTGDEALPEQMAAICAKDGNGTHVACDVHATRNWGLLQVSAGLEQIAERMAAEAEADDDADAPAQAPAATKDSSNRNRKSGH